MNFVKLSEDNSLLIAKPVGDTTTDLGLGCIKNYDGTGVELYAGCYKNGTDYISTIASGTAYILFLSEQSGFELFKKTVTSLGQTLTGWTQFLASTDTVLNVYGQRIANVGNSGIAFSGTGAQDTATNLPAFGETTKGVVPVPTTAIGRTLKDTGWDAPDLGARPYLPSADSSFLSSNDGSFIYLKGGVAYIGDGLGNTTTISLGVNVTLDNTENPIDVETTINGARYSLITGNSDTMGLPDASGTSYPIAQNLSANIGAYGSPRVIQGRTL